MTHAVSSLFSFWRIAPSRRAVTGLAAAAAMSAIVAPLATFANDAARYPERTIRVMVGFSAGSGVDISARVVSERLAEALKQTIVVENRAGAAGAIAAKEVANAAPDGYTLLSVSAGHVILPALSSPPPYNLKDFAGISPTISLPSALVVNAKLGVKSVAELIALAKAKPGTLTFSSGGTGSSTHFAGELFKSMAGIDVQHVPYKGIPEALTDVIANRISFTFSPLSSVMPQMAQGDIVVLGVANKARASILPNVPTVGEAGLPGYSWDTWFAFLAPGKTPSAIVQKLNKEVQRVLVLPETRKRWETIGAEPMPMSTEDFEKYMAEQHQLVSELVKKANIQVK
jgi:tripartite-type tricarboxylate transporter receptor subunit TctC